MDNVDYCCFAFCSDMVCKAKGTIEVAFKIANHIAKLNFLLCHFDCFFLAFGEFCNVVCYLGGYLNSTLSFTDHVLSTSKIDKFCF